MHPRARVPGLPSRRARAVPRDGWPALALLLALAGSPGCGGGGAATPGAAGATGATGATGAASTKGAAATAGAAAGEPVFEAEGVSPLTKVVPLQIASVFSYEADEKLITPATELLAIVDAARKKDAFGKKPLDALAIDPTPPSIKAEHLLLVAWGPRAEFSLTRAKEMGKAAMLETLKRGVTAMAYAPIVRDQGVTTLPADEVAGAFVEGALGEFLEETKAGKAVALTHVTYEAGPAFIDAVKKAVPRAVEAAHKHAAGL
jgi:hypothetical protein